MTLDSVSERKFINTNNKMLQTSFTVIIIVKIPCIRMLLSDYIICHDNILYYNDYKLEL